VAAFFFLPCGSNFDALSNVIFHSAMFHCYLLRHVDPRKGIAINLTSYQIVNDSLQFLEHQGGSHDHHRPNIPGPYHR
jgi:hypothetical protein